MLETSPLRHPNPRRRDATRGISALVAILLGLTALVASGGARAAEWIVLCTGYKECTAAGYPEAGYEAASKTSYWSQYVGHNCTNYVGYRLVQNGLPNVRPASLTGNATNWGPSFPNETNDSPAVGAIAWWDTSFSSTGHVAYVERVISNSEIIISEDNWGGEFRWRRVTFGGGKWPTGFIHFKDKGPSVAPPTRDWQNVAPARLLDTRTGLGAPKAVVPAGGAVTIQVAGRAGMPAKDVGAVLINVNVMTPTAAGYLTVHASGTAQPGSREVSYPAGGITTKTVLTRVGTDGKVRLYTSARADLSADIVGWSPAGGFVSGGGPARVLDTRTGLAAPKARLAAGGTLKLTVTGKAGIPTTGASAVLLDISATSPSAAGWATAWATGASRPATPQIRLEAGKPATGLVLAKIGTGGAVNLHSSVQTDLMVDIVGWLPTDADLVPVTPTRLLDSQTGLGITAGRVAAGKAPVIKIVGRAGVPAKGVRAAIVTVSSVSPTTAGYLTAYPSGTAEPAYASVKYAKGQTVTNTVVVPVGADGAIRVYTGGATYVKVDVQGYIRF